MASARDNAVARVVRDEPDNSAHQGEASDASRAKLEDINARRQAEAPATDAPAADARRGFMARWSAFSRKQKIFSGIGVLAAVAGVWFGTNYILIGRFLVTTDDAYVRANNTVLGAKVTGYLSKIAVRDNSEVKAGDLLFQIDDGDYVIAVNNAKAKIGTQEATIERIGRQAVAQQSAVEQMKAQLDSSQAAMKRADNDFVRQQQLTDRGFASKAVYDQSLATRDQSAAAVQSAQAQLESAQAQVDVIKSQKAEAEGQLAELKTTLAKAERDLAFTAVRAPVDGVISNRLVNEGDYIQVGQRLANIVPLNDVYIDANFKETQLGRIRPGQPVNVAVDALSGNEITGYVESLAPASGSVFTLLPPDNATGNFTKVVQRLPVRIRVPAAIAREHLLRAGMSVIVSVNTKQPPETKVAHAPN
ncbi:MAG: HlyD family secretion protein [Xanthobacteraceae bacterium]|nr:HlyD family secretion protein [Xanthobacteraceae bacterium]